MGMTPNDIERDMVPLPCPIMEGLVAPTPQALYVEGGVSCGKTGALAGRVESLVAGGADPAQVLVLCATPDAAAAFRARVAADVRVTTPRQWCIDALAARASREGTPAKRLLAPFEVDVLLEDLKTGGVRPKRLRQMLRFFYKSITELCDWNPDWLVTGEEEMTYGLLRACLDFEGGVLEAELSNVCARWLRDDAAALADFSVAHVLVDDYQQLSRASQVLANLLARESIAVAANPALASEVFESYPYAQGVEEFLSANPQAARSTLSRSGACAAAVCAVNRIAKKGGLDVAPVTAAKDVADELVYAHAENPALEKALVADLVKGFVDGGARPGQVAVVVPNGTWGKNVAAALRAAGVPASSALSPKVASGDLRELDRCVATRVLTALYLVADPADGIAWRSWCGFGNLFACSSAMAQIREAAVAEGLSAAEALRGFEPAGEAETNRAEWERVVAAQAEALDVLKGADGLAGEELLAFVTGKVAGADAQVPAAVRALVAPLASGELAGDDAAHMVARARRRIDTPFVDAVDAVRVVSLAEVAGTTPDYLVLCGFVNGFFPVKGVLDLEILSQEDSAKQVRKDLALLMNAVGKPARGLYTTAFDEASLELAERMGMKIRRVQLHDGARVAHATPSIYLDYICG